MLKITLKSLFMLCVGASGLHLGAADNEISVTDNSASPTVAGNKAWSVLNHDKRIVIGWQAAIQQVLDEETRLATIRNHQAESQSVYQAVERYVSSLKKLELADTPKIFQINFERYIAALEKFIPELIKFQNSQGSLKDIYDQAGINNFSFKQRELRVTQSWRNIETLVGFYQSNLPLKPFVFSSNRSGNSEIYLANYLSGASKNLTNNLADDNWPVISGDSKRLLFQSRRNDNLDVFMLDLITGTERQLTTHIAHDYLASFSPQKEFVYFTSWRASNVENQRTRFFRLDTRTSEIVQWTSTEPGNSTGIVWDNSGARVITTLKRGDNAQVYLLDEMGAIIRQLTNEPGYNAGGQVSPDGRKIAFYSSGKMRSRIGLVNINNPGDIQWVVKDGFNWYPQWSSDGKWLAFSRSLDSNHRNLNIYLIEISNPGFLIPIIESPARDSEFRWLN
ncbi:hypothetical protein FLL45_15190 [Aliikangiella marina]|uniref:Dipeptidylpeptidase IV N-terminal domain-containing protein n=1 Tax=Aliikangiella marina TaxID=1712262 RepID=A0A545T6L3_9GAMM|nr:PD40 domain-containing protein [Aliikangiella marina]TQV72812.1 hypothetical protein FLL45_15190 [Aliikangiella marina]